MSGSDWDKEYHWYLNWLCSTNGYIFVNIATWNTVNLGISIWIRYLNFNLSYLGWTFTTKKPQPNIESSLRDFVALERFMLEKFPPILQPKTPPISSSSSMLCITEVLSAKDQLEIYVLLLLLPLWLKVLFSTWMIGMQWDAVFLRRKPCSDITLCCKHD